MLLSNEDGMISDIEYFSPLGKSDHSLINFNFNCYIQHENTERVKYYYDQADLAGMKQELSTIDWEEKLSIQDENKQWKGFKDTVLCIQDKYTPKRKSRAATDRKGKTNIDLNTLKVIHKNTDVGLDL